LPAQPLYPSIWSASVSLRDGRVVDAVVKQLAPGSLRPSATKSDTLRRAEACSRVFAGGVQAGPAGEALTSCLAPTLGVGADRDQACVSDPISGADGDPARDHTPVPPGLYVVETAVHGVSVRELLLGQMATANSRPLYGLGDALKWVTQVARGLVALHELGALAAGAVDGSVGLPHGDLRAGNVLLQGIKPNSRNRSLVGQADAVLTDYCLGALTDIRSRVEALRGDVDYDDLVVYAAPEVAAGGRQTLASDVYSFGVVAAELLSHQLFFTVLSARIEGLDLPSFVAQMHHKRTRPQLPSSVPPALQELIQACWSHEPGRRPGMRQVLDHLQQYAGSEECVSLLSRASSGPLARFSITNPLARVSAAATHFMGPSPMQLARASAHTSVSHSAAGSTSDFVPSGSCNLGRQVRPPSAPLHALRSARRCHAFFLPHASDAPAGGARCAVLVLAVPGLCDHCMQHATHDDNGGGVC
jgi:serine/threonine protein kinase